jgi:hypothetical protein
MSGLYLKNKLQKISIFSLKKKKENGSFASRNNFFPF